MSLTFTILGCGSSMGVPRVGLGWGACNPANPKNRRRRCSLLVERHDEQGAGGRTTVLVDTSPDLRQQLLDAEVSWLDGVLFTHDHADHSHGIDDLRPLVILKRKRVDVYLDAATSENLRQRFGYCFETPPGSQYPPIVREHRLEAGEERMIAGAGGPITALPFLQAHGDTTTLGFRFGQVAYSCDLSGVLPEGLGALDGLDVWILDALRYAPHPSHLSVTDALAWVDRVKPKRAILTNLHSDLDYDALRAALPDHVEPAYDGLTISLDSA